MAKTHEVNLGAKAFDSFTKNDYIIIEKGTIESGDFILFKQVETIEGETTETGLYRMTQVSDIQSNDGLKDGYALFTIRKL